MPRSKANTLPADKEDILASDEDSVNKREKIGWWLKWIIAAKKAAESSWDDAACAWKEYENQKANTGETNPRQKKGYPIYAVCSWTLEPSYYSRTPIVKSKRLHGIEDEMALTMTLIADRLGQEIIKAGHFDEGMIAGRGDFMHASKATTQIVYTTQTRPQRMPLQLLPQDDQQGEPTYYESNPAEPYGGEVMQDDAGYFYNGNPQADEDTQKIFLAPACFDEILHTPHAKSQSEITEMAYKFSMEYDEAELKFNRNPDGSSKNLSLPYKTAKIYKDSASDSNDDGEAMLPGRVLEGWECYCMHSEQVYWICEEWKDDFLGREADPYDLEGFFPSPPFIMSNKPRKSMYPTPRYTYLESTANQLHTLYYRVFRLVDGVRRRALVYGLSKELIRALNNLDGEEYISVGDIDSILEKGGLENYIHYLPVKELVDALAETIQLEQHFKDNFYEWFGVPDILRGVSDAGETLGAQEIKSDAAHDRFKYDKKQIIELARNSAEIMLDMALKVYSDEKIARICGWEYMERGSPAMPPDEQNPQGVPAKPGHYERFPEALQRLRNDKDRVVSIDFETDSTSFRDEAREMARQNLISQTVLQGLGQISSIEHPGNMQIAMKMLLGVLESMGGSTQSEDMIKSAVADLKKAKDAPPPPPPPDYEGMKVQIAGQKNELQAQKDQMQSAIAQKELQLKEYALQLEGQKQQFEQALAAQTQASEEQKAGFDAQLKQFEASLDQALVAVEQQRVQIEEAKATVQAQESMMEEMRLAKDSDSEMAVRVAEILAAQAPAAPTEIAKPIIAPPPNVTIINGAARKQHTFQRDAQGNIIGVQSEEIQ